LEANLDGFGAVRAKLFFFVGHFVSDDVNVAGEWDATNGAMLDLRSRRCGERKTGDKEKYNAHFYPLRSSFDEERRRS